MKDIQESLKDNCTLKCLNLSECKINDETGVLIGQALAENKGIVNFLLYSNFISDKGGCAIGKALITNGRLKELDISSNQIGDKGCEGFVEGIISNTTVEGINLSNNKMYDASGQKLLQSLAQNKTLMRLKLALNPIANKFTNEIEALLKKNANRILCKHKTVVFSQFSSLQNEVAKTGLVKKEREIVHSEKKKLKEEIYEDVNILNDANNNKENCLDDLKQQLVDLAEYEQKIGTDIVETDKEIQVFHA